MAAVLRERFTQGGALPESRLPWAISSPLQGFQSVASQTVGISIGTSGTPTANFGSWHSSAILNVQIFRKTIARLTLPRVLPLIVLAVGTIALYFPALSHDFINYDDPDYILNNPHVNAGLTWSGIVWAFTHAASANWHPLTWISHMVDCQFFGTDHPGNCTT